MLEHTKACVGFVNALRLLKYHKSLRAPVTGLFETFSVDFAGPYRPYQKGKRFDLIVVNHIKGWQIAWAKESHPLIVVIKFAEK